MNYKFNIENLELNGNTFRMNLKGFDFECNVADQTVTEFGNVITKIAESERWSKYDRLEASNKDNELDDLKKCLVSLLHAILSDTDDSGNDEAKPAEGEAEKQPETTAEPEQPTDKTEE